MIATSGKRIAAVKRPFNRKKYLQMLTEAMPRIIETAEELDRANELIAPFLHPERELAPEIQAFVRLMLKLIEDYNRSNPAFPPMKPHELLQALMQEANLRQSDLLDIFGSRSRASEAVNGKRTISKQQARQLGERFCISPAAFIEI
jgi:HTH-type transcriptional regulator / antitoxin HigA